jgi:hypothetical protein
MAKTMKQNLVLETIDLCCEFLCYEKQANQIDCNKKSTYCTRTSKEEFIERVKYYQTLVDCAKKPAMLWRTKDLFYF